ncbi:hypothetical protein GGS26DRAFT_595683 [Hypomontagnella submonticulosa]|nr:hypothetical protein GGS26DRAFT_595683 [Hypomontagnella submonticulosa]
MGSFNWTFVVIELVIVFLLTTGFADTVVAHIIHAFKKRAGGHIIPSANSLQYVREQRAIADFSFLGKDELKSRLQARASPNERLVKAFGIENSFTTFDKVIHNKFLKKSRHAMQDMNSEKLIGFFNVARIALQRTLFHLNRPMGSQSLAELTRSFVFMATLHRFFGLDPSGVNIDDALQATDSINRLWMESKTPQPDLHEHRERLEAALKRLLPSHFPCEPEYHPLNTIIPAYETMWRVVLLTFISAGFRNTDRESIISFQQFVASAPLCFHGNWGSDNDQHAIILNFAKEGLRLYPPTRRIRRAVPNPLDGTHDFRAADIEACHRDPSIWGPDAAQYRPSRFRTQRHPGEAHAPYTADMKRAYMPFSVGKHRCPAADKFGERAIMVLVVVLARALGTSQSGSRIRLGDRALERDLTLPLPSGRLDMEGWTLEIGTFYLIG